jgi:Mg-chelatase subunit ChlD
MLLPGRGAERADRVGIVAFNDSAWVVQSPTSDRGELLEGLVGLNDQVAEGTRLDLALREADVAFDRPSTSRERVPVAVLLTDGLPNRVPTPQPSGSQEETVLLAAAQLKETGVRLFVVGVGKDDAADPLDRINGALLEAIASEPSMFYRVADAEELAGIYRAIANEIPCQ